MGAQLVGKAFAFAALNDLRPNEALLLVWMAHTALDNDKQPRYFASRDESAIALGRSAAEIAANRRAAHQAVKVAVAGLVKSGAIARIRVGREGTRAEYALRLDGLGKRGGAGREFLPAEVGNPYDLGRESLPEGYGIPTPQEPEEPQEPTTGINTTSSTTYIGAVDNSNRSMGEVA